MPNRENPPLDQNTLEGVAKRTACTFTVWTMIAGYFGVTNSLNETYEKTPESAVKKSNGYVYSETGIMGAAGIDTKNITVTTYNGTENGKATQKMVDTLNNGGVVHLRVSPTGTDKDSHSVVIDNYGFDKDNKFYLKVKDPDRGKYNCYDPETKQLFNIKNKGKENESRKYDTRTPVRFQTAEKK